MKSILFSLAILSLSAPAFAVGHQYGCTGPSGKLQLHLSPSRVGYWAWAKLMKTGTGEVALDGSSGIDDPANIFKLQDKDGQPASLEFTYSPSKWSPHKCGRGDCDVEKIVDKWVAKLTYLGATDTFTCYVAAKNL